MPQEQFSNVPSGLQGKMTRCVHELQGEGYSKEKATAICYTSIVEGLELGPLLEVAQRAEEADYPWDQCIADQMKRYGSMEKAKKVCGMIKHKYGKGAVAHSREHFEAKLEPRELTGKEWDITIIGPETAEDLVTIRDVEYIRSKNGRLYAVDGVRESAPRWEGVKVYDNHLTDQEFEERAGMRSFLGEGVGVLTKPHFNEQTRELRAILTIVDKSAREKLKEAHDEGVLKYIGLSVDTLTDEGKAVTYEGKRYPTVSTFEHILSLDVVSEPAAGGRFNRLLAAQQTEEVDMTITEERVNELIAEALAARTEQEEMPAEGEVTAEEAAEVVAEEVVAAIEVALEEVPEDAPPEEAAQMVAEVIEEAAAEVVEEIEEEVGAAPEPAQESAEMKRIRKLECELALQRVLDAAKLPAADRAVIEAAFKGRIFGRNELKRVVEAAKRAQAGRDTTGQVTGAGGSRILGIRGSMSPKETAEAGLIQLMADRGAIRGGMRALEANDNYYVKERWTEALQSWVRMGRPNYRPRNLGNWLWEFVDNPLAMRTSEANDVGSITKNSVNLFLAADYSVREEWWAPIVTELEVDTIDDATLVRAYGFENLDIVLEGGAYTAIELADDEETASVIKHGNHVGVTLETMLKDKLNVLQSIPKRLADSWYNTQSAKVSAVFTTNTNTGPVLGDSGALFNATAVTSATGHANLLTTALSFSEWGTVRTAMRKQTIQKLGAGRRAMIEPRFCLVPVDLETTALQIRNSEYEAGTGDNDVNPYYQKFEVLPVPDWTDAESWAAVADPALHPAIYMIYVRGHRVPQIYEAGDQTSGTMFTNDTWRYKVRLMLYRFSSTYDCAPVADFRPLHKSNV